MTTLQDAILGAEQALTDLDAAGVMFDALCAAKLRQFAAEAAAVTATEAQPRAAQLVREAEALYLRLRDERHATAGRPVERIRLDHAYTRASARLERREAALRAAE